jgi:hypothetical protein
MSASRVAAPRRRLNPFLLRHVERSGKPKTHIALVSGWPYYTTFYDTLREDKIRATALTITRLMRVADAVGFPRDQVFLDEVAQ